MSNIFIRLKKDLFGCFRIEEIRDKDNATGLKEGGGNRNVNLQCFPYTRLHALFAIVFTYLGLIQRDQFHFYVRVPTRLNQSIRVSCFHGHNFWRLCLYHDFDEWQKCWTNLYYRFYFFQIWLSLKIQNRRTHWANVVCKVVQRENKFKAVSNLVWVCWKARI